MAPKKKPMKPSTSASKSEAEEKKQDDKIAEDEAMATEESEAAKEVPVEEEGDFEGEDNEEDGLDQDDALEPEDAKDSAETTERKTEGNDGEDGNEEDGDGNEEESLTKDASKDKEKIKELEVDAESDSRDRVASSVTLSEYDSTLDVFFSGGGTIVSSLSTGGLQHLLSGVRANTGAKAGRYYFEAKILEKKTLEQKKPMGSEKSHNSLRVGVSVAKSSLFLGDGTTDNVGFDMEGMYYAATPEDKKHKTKAFTRRVQVQVIGILLNLESGTANANTLSLFLDGVRMCEPQPLPQHLVGKALYPTITFKNFTLAVNLGSEGLLLKSLPFKCRMFGDISAADAESSSFIAPDHRSKYSVVVPVGLPEEGFFDYVDRFIERHPEYVELSDRKIYEWCEKSGLECWYSMSQKNSRDRPVFNFGHKLIDNGSMRPLIRTITQLVKRHYVVAELKGNWLSKEREEVLSRFGAPHFSVTAHVAIGEPSAEHKEWVHNSILALHAKKQAELAAIRKRNEERKKQKDNAKDGKSGDVKKEEEDVKKEEDNDDDLKEEADEDEPAAKKQKVAPEVGPDVWWLKATSREGPDVLGKDVAKQYLNFSLPSEPEGFEKVEFVWSSKSGVEEYLKRWTSEKKATLVVEGLKAGDWFKEKQKAWEKIFKEMKAKKEEKKKTKDDDKEKKKSTDDDKEKKKTTDDDKTEKKDDAKSEEKAEEDDKMKEEDAPPPDPLHAGGEDGKPLYANFQREDWELLRWRYELHLVLHSFAIDVEDPEYVGIPLDHIGHYFNVYFGKFFKPRCLGCDTIEEVVELMDDVFKIDTKGKLRFFTPLLSKDCEVAHFVAKVEEEREDRNRRMEAGDESARLKIPDDRDGKDRKKKGSGKGKKGSKKGRDSDTRKEGVHTQDRRGTIQGKWVRQKSFFRKKQDRDGHWELARPREQQSARPWDRSRTVGQAPRFGNKAGFGKGVVANRRPMVQRGHQDSRKLQMRRSAPQDSRHASHQPAATKQEAPRRHGSEPDTKRPRRNSSDYSHIRSTPPARQPQSSREAQTDRRPQSSQQSGRGREPQRDTAPGASPSSANSRPQHRDASRSGKSQSKGNHSRDNGSDRDRKGSFRDSSSGGRDHRDGGGHRPSSSQQNWAKGGDRKSHENGSNRAHSASKGGKGSGRDDRKDGRDRGKPSSRPESRSDHHSSDRNRSSSRWPF